MTKGVEMKIKHYLAASILASSMIGLPQAAWAINVGGVIFDPGPIFQFANILENQPLGVGQELKGFGIVTQINTNLQNNFCPNCELTFTFEDFIVASLGDGNDFIFSGGTVKFFSDITKNYNPTNDATAGDGNLWLELAGDEFTKTSGANTGTGTLIAFDVSFSAGAVTNFGEARFDVVGGPAAQNFATQGIISPDITDGASDFSFTSSFQLARFPLNLSFPIQGTGELQGFAVPEPGSLALVGLGLLGFGARFRNRKIS
jgi:hypothetical protein